MLGNGFVFRYVVTLLGVLCRLDYMPNYCFGIADVASVFVGRRYREGRGCRNYDISNLQAVIIFLRRYDFTDPLLRGKVFA